MADETIQMGLRVPASLKAQIEEAAKAEGFTNASEWIRVQLARAVRGVLSDPEALAS